MRGENKSPEVIPDLVSAHGKVIIGGLLGGGSRSSQLMNWKKQIERFSKDELLGTT